MSDAKPSLDPEAVIAATRQWLEKAVIGLNLCPFAKHPYTQQRVRFVVSAATTQVALVDELLAELDRLAATPAAELETTLLIHPQVLHDFLDYNDFLDAADQAVESLGLEGEIQVASFHPQYQFADTAADDIENATNRAPYPTLHLLREASVSEAVRRHPDVEGIPGRNVETLRRLGAEGWRQLFAPERAPLTRISD